MQIIALIHLKYYKMLRIKEIRKKKNLTQDQIVERTGIRKRSYVDYENEKADISLSKLQIIAKVLNVTISELLNEEKEKISKNLIPFYEDVATIGGDNLVAETGAIYNTSVLIDAGDWFQGATAAIRHYGDSMVEYPSGCILAIRELNDKSEISWGRNYVVETSERRITKQIGELDEKNIICYSTNTSIHPDGRLKHQPITILKENIRYISRVLGSVNKEESTGKVQLL